MTRLKMDAPAAENALDRGVQGVIGKPVDRIEGPLKVSGTAPYSYEFPIEAAHGFLVTATIGKGQLRAINASAALAMAGVRLVWDIKGKAPLLGAAPIPSACEITYFGQPLLLIVADSFEIARDAALAIRLEHAHSADSHGFDNHHAHNHPAETPDWIFPAVQEKGDVETALAQAVVTLDGVWTTPSHSHAAMEPHVTIAAWDGDELTIYAPYQMLGSVRRTIAQQLGHPVDKIRLVARYVGGGFGGKIGLAPETIPAALAARHLGHPVKVALTRRQVFQSTCRRGDTRQRIQLGATADGRLTAIAHDTVATNLPGQTMWEPAGFATIGLYAAENRRIAHSLAHLHTVPAAAMRAPGEAVGMLALENAMDELAEKLGLDPIELRRRNDPAQDPFHDRPFSSRNLMGCFDEGARLFGWDQRDPKPGQRREGEWLIGLGVASAARDNMFAPSSAWVGVNASGKAVIETDMTDIGTGTYTILAQIAAETLGLPISAIEVRLGDTRFPMSSGSGGSFGAASSGSSVLVACESIIAKLAEKMEVPPEEMTLQDGMVTAGNRRLPIGDLIGPDGIDAIGTIQPGAMGKTYSQVCYGAHFAEVAVSAVTGEVRVRRMLGVFAAGRILNEKTARSQCFGGMIFGIGGALTEAMEMDRRTGQTIQTDLGDYHLPSHADVPALEVVFLPEHDNKTNPLGAKGLGELAISGSGAAVTNAVYNATGFRVRDYPLTLDQLLEHLPD